MESMWNLVTMMMILMVMVFLRPMVPVMVMELLINGNYLFETFKMTFFNYVYPHLLLIGFMCIFMFVALYIGKLVKFVILKNKLFGVTEPEGLKPKEDLSEPLIV